MNSIIIIYLKKNIKFLFILSLLLYISFNSIYIYSFEKDTTFSGCSICSDINAGIIFHNSNFFTLPGIINCCDIDNIVFDHANGLNYSFMVGLSKYNDIFNGIFTSLNLGFNNIKGNYVEKAKIGNWIDGDYIADIISEQILNVSFYNVSIVPLLDIFLFDRYKIPLSVRFGPEIGFVVFNNYNMYEQLLNPPEAYFENMKKIRNENSGSIKDINSVLFSLTGGINYELFSLNDIKLSSSLLFSYCFSNIVKNVEWKFHKINLGMNLRYDIPKNITVIDEPILPKLPLLIVPKTNNLELNTIVYCRKSKETEKEIYNNSTIEIPVVVEKNIYTNTVMPVILFENNTANILQGYDKKIFDNVKKSNEINVVIGLAFNEKQNLFLEREKAIKALLYKNNIDTSNIIFTLQSHKKQRYNDIDEEKSFAKFIVEPILYEVETKTDMSNISAKELIIKSYIDIEETIPYNYSVDYKIGDDKYNSSVETLVLILNENTLKWQNNIENREIDINIQVTDIEQKVKNKKFHFNVVPNIQYNKYINTDKHSGFLKEYIIGFFDFDNDDFIYVSNDIINEIEILLEEGYKVALFGCTDHLGSNEYNEQLAKKRAIKAKLLFDDKYKDNIIIEDIDKKNINLINPYSRIYSRVVFARIFK